MKFIPGSLRHLRFINVTSLAVARCCDFKRMEIQENCPSVGNSPENFSLSKIPLLQNSPAENTPPPPRQHINNNLIFRLKVFDKLPLKNSPAENFQLWKTSSPREIPNGKLPPWKITLPEENSPHVNNNHILNSKIFKRFLLGRSLYVGNPSSAENPPPVRKIPEGNSLPTVQKFLFWKIYRSP